MSFIIAFFTGCFGSAISVICGFGLGVFSMMFLPHFMFSTMAASAVVSITAVFQSAWIAFHYRKKVKIKDTLFMVIGYLVLSTICVIFGKNIPNKTLKLALGIFLIVLSIYFIFFSKKIKMQPTPRNGLIAGSLGGIMSSMFGVGGPPAGLYFSSCYDEKEDYLATIQTYFLVTNIYVTTIRAFNGIVTAEVLLASSVSLVGMVFGTYMGKKLFDKMNADAVRKAIYILMAVSGVILIAGSL